MKTLSFPILALLATFFVTSCQQKPGGSDAEVGAAQEVDQLSAQAVNYPLDTEASELTWYGFKPTGRHNGTIGIQDGMLAVENGTVVGGSFTMDLNSIDVLDLEGEDKQKLTGHLQSPDFFNVEQYPNAKFEITEVVPYAEAKMDADTSRLDVVVNDEAVDEYTIDNPTHAITGNLTMRDTTLSIMFPAKVSITGDQIMAQAKFNIDRTKWNVSYGDENDMEARAKDKFIYNTVNVGFDIKADKEAEATASTL
ncbi:MAG: YceI family protein [Tunicatimonas sp.]